MGLAGVGLAWALADAAWRSRAAVSSFLSFACSSAVIAGFSRFGGRSSTGKYFCCGDGASARASINDELELAQPPSERLDNSTALTASAVTCPLTYAMPMLRVLRALRANYDHLIAEPCSRLERFKDWFTTFARARSRAPSPLFGLPNLRFPRHRSLVSS